MSKSRLKKTAANITLRKALAYIEDDPEENIPKLMNLADKISPNGWYDKQRASFRKAIEEKGNWYELILRVYRMDEGIRKRVLENFIFKASLEGSFVQKAYAEGYGCNIPWAILMDPTSSCNMHCRGCWAAEYDTHMNLDYETMDSIVSQGKEMGTNIYIFTGGEPLLRKTDILRLCEKHQDCMFLAFTNGTLIDEDFCLELLRVQNFVTAISLEGFEEANDARRGKGTFHQVRDAMELLQSYKIPFGISTCYTSRNIDDVSSEAYFDMMVESGAFFVWFFHYMPIGRDADVSLLPKPEQREKMFHRIQQFRRTKPIFSIDFQNDGMYAGGCIAGGRKYLHINANGDIEPCAFIHYADSNIHKDTLLEAYRKPLFLAYHYGQPFNENPFRPCPMLENPDRIEGIVRDTGARKTDVADAEEIEDLCKKTRPYARAWTPTANRLWAELRGEPICNGEGEEEKNI